MNLRHVIVLMILLVPFVSVSCILNLPAVHASNTIFILPNGDISPSSVNITTSDRRLYAFTGNVNDTIVIQRSNITLDGAGYTLTAPGKEQAIYSYLQNNITIMNLRIESSKTGIFLEHSTHCNITQNAIVGNSWHGIYLDESTNNVILGNNITDNSNRGIYLSYSSHNTIQDNEVSTNYRGIELNTLSNHNVVSRNRVSGSTTGNILLNSYSDHNTVSENNITQSVSSGIAGFTNKNNTITHNIVYNHSNTGIDLGQCQNWTVTGNEVTYVGFGMHLRNSNCSVLRQNIMINNTCGFIMSFYRESDFNNDVDDSNTVDGKPIYYWVEKENMTIPSDAGIVVLYKCANITVERLSFTATNYYSLILGYSTRARIADCSIINSTYAISLWNSSSCFIESNYLSGFMGLNLEYSTSNMVYNNTFTHGGNWGAVGISMSSGNTFYHNNFTDNYYDVLWLDSSVNNWDNGYPDGGNYWDRYVTRMINPTDTHSGPYQNITGSDGFWDVPYPVDPESFDNYPIVPEFPNGIIALPLVLATLIAAIVYKRKNRVAMCPEI